MSDQPWTGDIPQSDQIPSATTGEWTVEYVIMLGVGNYVLAGRIADAHNAALAAERKLTRAAERDVTRMNLMLTEQLAIERDRANVRETELICERDYFKKELAAEREKHHV